MERTNRVRPAGEIELLLRLERDAAAPLHRQLERELRAAIRDGRLRPGAPLPASRALAARLGVSRGVVVEAYGQLAAEGYLTARPGSGTRVAPGARAHDGAAEEPGRASGAAAPAGPRVRYDLHPGVPDLAGFPHAAWQRSARRALRRAPHAALGYGDARGLPELRTALADYLGRARGTLADPERVVVTAGFQQGLALLCRALAARGARRVAVEDPGFVLHRLVIQHAGLEAVPVPVDGEGLRVESLAGARADAVVVTAAHQFPTGAVLAPARRAALLAWAAAHDALVIEDDYDAEYRYDRGPVGALQGLAPERVAYAGSASKILAPGLRLGWLVLPAGLADAVGFERAMADGGGATPPQLALADFLAHGELDRHLRRMRRRYRERRDALVAGLARALPGAEIRGASAGLHALAVLAPGTDAGALVEAGRARGVLVHDLAWHSAGAGGHPPALLLGYANHPPEALAHAMALLGEARLAQGWPSRSPSSPTTGTTTTSSASATG